MFERRRAEVVEALGVDRLREGEAEVDRPDDLQQRAHDDPRAARGAGDELGAPLATTIVGLIDERGRLPGRGSFGRPGVTEVGQLVVEQDPGAGRDDGAAELLLDRARQRDGVAAAVDDRHVRRAAVRVVRRVGARRANALAGSVPARNVRAVAGSISLRRVAA